ncbi:hypothetical protein [Chromobacterium sp. IIBBL 290-4]|uniref:hypothetical protein n=1 Tax=Chromobacterium sp. IIBBL 290-4 TaxID=2953890 RepID=UPI0020B80A48|nr:hypothetical protein [Chromobacterium sp. IIBBL 290-4]UTH72716.1 hypothetical protein NKT35_14340 [Chromobacterium sp. IIBBL 290-4]
MQSKSVIVAALIGVAGLTAQAVDAQPNIEATPQSLSVQASAAANAARKGLAEFSKQVLSNKNGNLPDGFPLDVASASELAAARVGYGFPVYSVNPQKLMAADADISRLMTPTGSWRFIIYSGSKPIGLVTVEQVRGQWQAIAYGAIGLARNVEALQTAYGNAGRSNTRFLRVFQAQSDFLEVMPEQGGKPQFAALASAYESLLLKRQSGEPVAPLMDGAALMEPLRAAVRSNLANWR